MVDDDYYALLVACANTGELKTALVQACHANGRAFKLKCFRKVNIFIQFVIRWLHDIFIRNRTKLVYTV